MPSDTMSGFMLRGGAARPWQPPGGQRKSALTTPILSPSPHLVTDGLEARLARERRELDRIEGRGIAEPEGARALEGREGALAVLRGESAREVDLERRVARREREGVLEADARL